MSAVMDAIRPYAERGMRPLDIAKKTGLNADTVRGAMSRLRQEGLGVPYFSSGPQPTHLTSPETTSRLREAAEKRGLTPRELARKIIDTVLFEDILDAVLDDQDGRR